MALENLVAISQIYISFSHIICDSQVCVIISQNSVISIFYVKLFSSMQINNISTLVKLVLFVLQVSYIRFHVIKTNNIRLITVSYSDAIGAFF